MTLVFHWGMGGDSFFFFFLVESDNWRYRCCGCCGCFMVDDDDSSWSSSISWQSKLIDKGNPSFAVCIAIRPVFLDTLKLNNDFSLIPPKQYHHHHCCCCHYHHHHHHSFPNWGPQLFGMMLMMMTLTTTMDIFNNFYTTQYTPGSNNR